MTHKSVLLDTSFFLRFLNDADPLFNNADGYFKYFLEKDIVMMVSTISIAEYCVRGTIQELPLKTVQILPFNLDHAKRTGEFARIVFDHKKSLQVTQRAIIPNDTKLFARADVEPTIDYYISSDGESEKIFDLLKQHTPVKFQFINLSVPHHETFGILNL
ncbi:MAG: hypothetical protein Q8L88_05325 [Bacteroidota bacterium]|nr:hypothetical protein [Bacteroidota bacterium]